MSVIKTVEINDKTLYLVEETVKVFRRNHSDLPGDDPEEHNKKIGSSMGPSGKGLTGLTMEEEVKFLPNIVKTKPTSEHWESAVDTYAHNITAKVPNKGKPLNISMRFEKEADAEKYLKRSLSVKVGIEHGDYQSKMVEALSRTYNGTPMNVADYILWRYCLIYNKVANEPEFVNKSQNIWFYLKDESREKTKQLSLTENRSKAYARYLAIKDNDAELSKIMRLFDKKPDFFDKGEKIVVVEDLAIKQPTKFINYTNKTFDLDTVSFIKQALEAGILEIMDNTEIIKQVGGEQAVLGNSLEAAAKRLKTKDGEQLYKLLKTQLQVTTKS